MTTEEFVERMKLKRCEVCKCRFAFGSPCPLCREKAHWDQIEREGRREFRLIVAAVCAAGFIAAVVGCCLILK